MPSAAPPCLADAQARLPRDFASWAMLSYGMPARFGQRRCKMAWCRPIAAQRDTFGITGGGEAAFLCSYFARAFPGHRRASRIICATIISTHAAAVVDFSLHIRGSPPSSAKCLLLLATSRRMRASRAQSFYTPLAAIFGPSPHHLST